METIAEFLRELRPGPWWLVAIKDGTLRGQVFDRAIDAQEWAELRNQGGWNLYYHINPHKQGSKAGKATRADIAAVEWLYADIDPNSDLDYAEEQQRLLELANSAEATISVFSGNGVQLLWRLAEAQPVSAQIESEIHTIGQLLGGDAVQNADRVFRLPFTTNWPNAKKQELGRTPSKARLLNFNKTTWSVPDVLRWARSVKTTNSHQSGSESFNNSNDDELVLPSDIETIIRQLSDKVKQTGVDRSRVLWHACN